jgi:tryptophan 2,3-dioxygenase
VGPQGVATAGGALGLDARHAVDAWWREALDLTLPRRPTEDWCADFPYEVVLRHWHAVGRAAVDPLTVAAIDGATATLAADTAAAAPGSWAWFLRHWLTMLVDITHDRCSYATYVGTPALEELPEAPWWAAAGVDGPDAVIGLLLAHLLHHESKAAMRGDGDVETLVARTAILSESVVRHSGPFPDVDGESVLDRGAQLAERVLDAAPTDAVRQLELLSVPMTTIHDEHMFLRLLQLFETVFVAMRAHIERARALLEVDDIDPAAAEVEQAAACLGRSIPYFRVLGTMKPETFAGIRNETPGASGLQSTGFKGIELACARQLPDRLASPGYQEPTVAALINSTRERATIEEHALRLVAARGRDGCVGLLAATRSLDQRWGQWKKAHWSTAFRLIGPVPGTGGTEGPSYLRAHMKGSLFPRLSG